MVDSEANAKAFNCAGGAQRRVWLHFSDWFTSLLVEPNNIAAKARPSHTHKKWPNSKLSQAILTMVTRQVNINAGAEVLLCHVPVLNRVFMARLSLSFEGSDGLFIDYMNGSLADK